MKSTNTPECAALAPAKTAKPALKSSKHELCTEFTLSNGIKVIHKEINENPIVTLEIFLTGGIINETPQKAGIASLTQDLMTQETKNRNAEALAAEVEEIGSNIIFETGYDYSTIGISAMEENIGKAAELISDIILNPAFDEKQISKEKANVLASLKSRKDQISTTASDKFNAAFYGSHPYSWPEQGKEATVAKFTKADFVNWHREFYVSNNMALVIAGKIKLDAAKALSEKYFASISSGTLMAQAPAPKAPAAKNVKDMSPKFQQAFLMIGFPAPSLAKDEFFTLKTLNGLLGGRMTGRLFMELREKLSLAYEVSSYYPSRKELSRFVIYIGLDKKNIPVARKRIEEILSDLKTNPVSEKELTDTKNFLKGSYLLDRQTVGRQAWYLGWWEAMGLGYAYDTAYLDDLMAVTSEDIQKAANKYFTSGMVSVELVPGQPAAPKKKKKK